MRISELSRASGVPVATIKYYLREGLLPAGVSTSATQAVYDDAHVSRLLLVRALVEVAGLSIAQVRSVLACVDDPPSSWHDVLGAAHSALPSSGARSSAMSDAKTRVKPGAKPGDPVDPVDARAAVDTLGWQVHPQTPALADLQRALDAVAAAGMPISAERLAVYGSAASTVAEVDVAGVPTSSPEQATRYVVLGTLLYEPVLLALRRLAQVDVSGRRFGDQVS